jgi:EAL domain-containing protein (putative c-di-GMP-specific phosphodiesterase class I)
MAHGLDVVAEGVETEAQRSALADLGCRHAQGFYFARPGPLPDRAPVDVPPPAR